MSGDEATSPLDKVKDLETLKAEVDRIQSTLIDFSDQLVRTQIIHVLNMADSLTRHAKTNDKEVEEMLQEAKKYVDEAIADVLKPQAHQQRD